MASLVLSRPLLGKEIRGGSMWEAFRPLYSLNLSILAVLLPSSLFLCFLSLFTSGLLMHVITKVAAAGGYREILMPEMLPWWHPSLHQSISILTATHSTAVLLSHYCNHYTIIPSLQPTLCVCVCVPYVMTSCLVTRWQCFLSCDTLSDDRGTSNRWNRCAFLNLKW